MGYKLYGDDEPKRSRMTEFFENFFAAFMAFSGCIGGWLVHFGLPVAWMLIITSVAASVMAIKLAEK